MLINFSSVSFGYGDNLILSDVAFSINEGEKIGLVGENGAGKTTLLKLITRQLLPDEGEITQKNGVRIGYLEQNGGYDSENTVFGEMLETFKEELSALDRLNALSAELAACEYGSPEYLKKASKIEALNKYAASHDCYNIEVKIKSVLGGMGFDGFYDRKISCMSGGEKTRLKLARLLLESPDLLILDEPTNHLDLKTLSWLEGYMSGFKGAVFVVSHDRYFLDRTVNSTFEIENKKLSVYVGNYTKYKVLKSERYERALREYEKQREEIEKLQTYVDKNIVRATTAKSAQSRVKKLERMEILEKPFTPPKPPRFSFGYARTPAEEVLKVSGLKLSAGGKILVEDINFTVRRGDKIAIVGDNGAGKSTLLKQLISGENPCVTVGRYVGFAYYDQEMANLDGEQTVLQELWGRHVAVSQTEIRASLARCGLFPEDIDKKVSSLSGGERAKLALCVFENERGNVLVLDEPTNHLDLPARESLERALKDFDGTVIFVSHDRYFISAVAGKIAEIESGVFTLYESGYEGYRAEKEKLAQKFAEAKERASQEEYERRKQAAYRSKKDRANEAKLKAEIKAVEGEIALAEERERQINEALSDPSTASDYTRTAPLLEELNSIQTKLEELYARYGELI